MARAAKVTLHLDNAKVIRVVGGQSKAAVSRAANKAAARARANVAAAGRINTGRLRDSIKAWDATVQPMQPQYAVVAGVSYAIYQEEGTGGSQAAPGHVLVFKPKGASMVIFRPRTGPVPGAHFMRNALKSSVLPDFAP